jgi:hypothetical protein
MIELVDITGLARSWGAHRLSSALPRRRGECRRPAPARGVLEMVRGRVEPRQGHPGHGGCHRGWRSARWIDYRILLTTGENLYIHLAGHGDYETGCSPITSSARLAPRTAHCWNTEIQARHERPRELREIARRCHGQTPGHLARTAHAHKAISAPAWPSSACRSRLDVSGAPLEGLGRAWGSGRRMHGHRRRGVTGCGFAEARHPHLAQGPALGRKRGPC